jgi:hypothetical protein
MDLLESRRQGGINSWSKGACSKFVSYARLSGLICAWSNPAKYWERRPRVDQADTTFFHCGLFLWLEGIIPSIPGMELR